MRHALYLSTAFLISYVIAVGFAYVTGCGVEIGFAVFVLIGIGTSFIAIKLADRN